MKLRTPSALLALIIGLVLPIAALAALVTLSAGTQLNVTTDSELDSGSAQVGDAFSAHVQPPFPYGNNALAGAVVIGHVVQVQKAGQGTKPGIALRFDSLRLADGSSAPINAVVSDAQPKAKMKNGARVAAYTLGGLIVGNVLAKTVFGSGAKQGGLIGAAGGFLIGNNYKSDITFPANSAMTIKMQHSVAVRRQARRR